MMNADAPVSHQQAAAWQALNISWSAKLETGTVINAFSDTISKMPGAIPADQDITLSVANELANPPAAQEQTVKDNYPIYGKTPFMPFLITQKF
jgi:hypothetical protein